MADMDQWVHCEAGRWTTIWQGPTLGATTLGASSPVLVAWRRFAFGFPPYIAGQIPVVGETTIVHGGAALYLRLDVNPAATTDFRVG